MILNKKAANWLIFLFVAVLALIFASGAAATADEKKPTPGVISFEEEDDDDDDDRHPGRHEDEDDEDDENERHHDRLREQYGEVEQVFLPPLVVTDPSGLGKGAIVPDPGVLEGDKLVDATFIDPQQHAPIDPKSIQASRNSPADSFFQMASVAIGSMAAGSIALGAFAIRRSVRLRNTEDADYFYK